MTSAWAGGRDIRFINGVDERHCLKEAKLDS